jgi:hypothetical protein
VETVDIMSVRTATAVTILIAVRMRRSVNMRAFWFVILGVALGLLVLYIFSALR